MLFSTHPMQSCSLAETLSEMLVDGKHPHSGSGRDCVRLFVPRLQCAHSPSRKGEVAGKAESGRSDVPVLEAAVRLLMVDIPVRLDLNAPGEKAMF